MKDLNYTNSESTIKPDLLDIGETTVYVRRNIAETTKDDQVIYTYEEATLTKKEFEIYAASLILKEQLDAAVVSASIVNNQVTSESNQIAMMSAIAEVYETLVPDSE